MGVFKIKVI